MSISQLKLMWFRGQLVALRVNMGIVRGIRRPRPDGDHKICTVLYNFEIVLNASPVGSGLQSPVRVPETCVYMATLPSMSLESPW